MKTANSVVLDYSVDVIQLQESDFILDYGELGNFSVAGFEMKLRRHVSHYLITYYLPSGIATVTTIYHQVLQQVNREKNFESSFHGSKFNSFHLHSVSQLDKNNYCHNSIKPAAEKSLISKRQRILFLLFCVVRA